MADVPLLVISENATSERRITPSWTVSQLKTKLETMTGVPPATQRLFLKTSAKENVAVEASDEEATHVSAFPLHPYAELHVSTVWQHAVGAMVEGATYRPGARLAAPTRQRAEGPEAVVTLPALSSHSSYCSPFYPVLQPPMLTPHHRSSIRGQQVLGPTTPILPGWRSM